MLSDSPPSAQDATANFVLVGYGEYADTIRVFHSIAHPANDGAIIDSDIDPNHIKSDNTDAYLLTNLQLGRFLHQVRTGQSL